MNTTNSQILFTTQDQQLLENLYAEIWSGLPRNRRKMLLLNFIVLLNLGYIKIYPFTKHIKQENLVLNQN